MGEIKILTDICGVDISAAEKEQLLPISEDEYSQNGLPYCKKCNTPRFLILKHAGRKLFIVRCFCECQKEHDRIETEKEIQKARTERFRARQKLSDIGENYFNANFETAEILPQNTKAYEIFKKYAAQWGTCRAENIGIYLYGPNSSGKTHLAACLANSLVSAGCSVLCTSMTKIVAEIMRSWSDSAGGTTQGEATERVARKDFVFIDDLGKEFLGREFDGEKSKFAERVLLDVINARYNNSRPTIFSSNYSILELQKKFWLDAAITERIAEMCPVVVKLDGYNFRGAHRKEKVTFAKKILCD